MVALKNKHKNEDIVFSLRDAHATMELQPEQHQRRC